MPQYEHVFLARQDVSAQQAQSLLEEFSKVINDNGGQVGKTEYWGLKPLAYKIKKNRKAHYHMMNIDAPHEAVAEMERQMRLSGDVIRFLTLRVGELDDKPSPMMKRSEERRGSRRGGRGGGQE
ncbi:30S ribosomal protein S6 [Dichotomicrobium thermohalophilum]|uniref:Small ribosomal subunit protein bS6 n=1 Tax=Dichotomicrobium thermohalophilum TaxID=933063 RepID=A0A397QEI1_9HYPH|nr:30S ribosomal protein S6 [Dichotomicrobium thermohalophilum]RIA56474.1 SSU ribosomal protein S6P [Dichotomicrobium thermohalophilum]